jgi:hypothetical protein
MWYSEGATALQEPISAFKRELAERNRLRNALNQQRRPGGYRGLPHPGFGFQPYQNIPNPGAVGGDVDRLPLGGVLLAGTQWNAHDPPNPAVFGGRVGILGSGGPFGGLSRVQCDRTGLGGRRLL